MGAVEGTMGSRLARPGAHVEISPVGEQAAQGQSRANTRGVMARATIQLSATWVRPIMSVAYTSSNITGTLKGEQRARTYARRNRRWRLRGLVRVVETGVELSMV